MTNVGTEYRLYGVTSKTTNKIKPDTGIIQLL